MDSIDRGYDLKKGLFQVLQNNTSDEFNKNV